MKPPAFAYTAATSLDEALELLAQYGYDAKIIAGGQSLMPALNMRLVQPAYLVDINRVPGLAEIEADGGGLRLGALVRHVQLERSPVIQAKCPLLAEVAPFIGHAAIRNRGTLGGSLSHADPAAELPIAMLALDAAIHLRSTKGERTLPAAEFFLGFMTTALEPDELLTHVDIPALLPGAGWAFTEVSRRHGDFALAGAAVLLHQDAKGCLDLVRVALCGMATGAPRLTEVESAILQQRPEAGLFEEAGRLASRLVEVEDTQMVAAGYQRRLTGLVVQDALTKAFSRMKSLREPEAT